MPRGGPEDGEGARALGSGAGPRRWKFRAALALGAAFGAALGLGVFTPDGPLRVRLRALRRAFEAPTVKWQVDSPAAVGLDAAGLERLWEKLRQQRTDAFLVVRRGRLVFERYGPEHTANTLHQESALAKAVTAVSALLVAMQDGRIALGDPLAKYADLGPDAQRSRIHIRDLVFHMSGLDDVDFYAGDEGKLEGWQKDYYERREKRFDYALRRVPLLFEPATQMRYAGVGYYALAYAVTKSLAGAPDADILTLLRDRVMHPLGIEDRAWKLSYGESYEQEGLRLYAFGSGLDMTPRAAARIGEWMQGKGTWKGQTLVAAGLVDQVLGRDPAEAPSLLSTHHGWLINATGKWPSLPRDAFFGYGGGDQVVLVVPSLELVAVRNGGDLAEPSQGEEGLDQELFAPLLERVRG